MNFRTVPHIKIYKPNHRLGLFCLLLYLFFFPYFTFAQNKVVKLEKEFHFNKEVTVNITSSHTDIIISTWSQNNIKIVAQSHGDASDDFIKASNNIWDLQWQKTDSVLVIKTDASKQTPLFNLSTNNSASDNLNSNNFDASNAVATSQIWHPIIKQSNIAEMPQVLKNQLKQTNFNFEAYQNLGEMYFKIWEYNLVNNPNKDNGNFSNNALAELEQWYNQMTKSLLTTSDGLFKATASASSSATNNSQHTAWGSDAIKRTIEIKVPENCVTKLNAHFGTLILETKLNNISANLKYTTFIAEEIDGKNTTISVAAAPVKINKWNSGKLNLKYVKKAVINTAEDIILKTVSSKVHIANLISNGEFTGSFSQLKIDGVDNNVNSLSFLNTNGDIELTLPQSPFNFAYSGEMSGIKIPPNRLTLKPLGDYRKLMLHGYSQSRNTDRFIQMNVIHSQVLLK